MNVPVEIKCKDGKCSKDCIFLNANFLTETGKCSLFKEPLDSRFVDYGQRDGFYQCDECLSATARYAEVYAKEHYMDVEDPE